MSEGMEARVARLEAEVKRLSEFVGKFTIDDVEGDVNISVMGSVQGMSVTTNDVNGDVAVSMQSAQGVSVGCGDVSGDVAASTGNGSMVVNTGDVGGEVG